MGFHFKAALTTAYRHCRGTRGAFTAFFLLCFAIVLIIGLPLTFYHISQAVSFPTHAHNLPGSAWGTGPAALLRFSLPAQYARLAAYALFCCTLFACMAAWLFGTSHKIALLRYQQPKVALWSQAWLSGKQYQRSVGLWFIISFLLFCLFGQIPILASGHLKVMLPLLILAYLVSWLAAALLLYAQCAILEGSTLKEAVMQSMKQCRHAPQALLLPFLSVTLFMMLLFLGTGSALLMIPFVMRLLIEHLHLWGWALLLRTCLQLPLELYALYAYLTWILPFSVLLHTEVYVHNRPALPEGRA
jgi:hypothetical protein